jgi:hypothetical protein
MGRTNLTTCFLIGICALLSYSCSRKTYGGFADPIPEQQQIVSELTIDVMITAFHQGAAGNCASIAVIKSAMLKFGKKKTFKSCLSTVNGYDIVLQNGKAISITKDEIDRANKKAMFVQGSEPEVFAEAQFNNAVLCKLNLDFLKLTSIEDAADRLNGKQKLSFVDIIKLLGIEDFYNEANVSKYGDFLNLNNMVLGNKFHAAFSGKGYYDEYGQKTLIREFSENHHTIFNSGTINQAYILNP